MKELMALWEIYRAWVREENQRRTQGSKKMTERLYEDDPKRWWRSGSPAFRPTLIDPTFEDFMTWVKENHAAPHEDHTPAQ